MTEMVLKMLVFSPLNQLTRLVPGNILLYNVAVKVTSHTSLNLYVYQPVNQHMTRSKTGISLGGVLVSVLVTGSNLAEAMDF
jgi:hypothetical protein